MLEEVRAEFHELGRERLRGRVDHVSGTADGAIVGEDAQDTAGRKLTACQKPG